MVAKTIPPGSKFGKLTVLAEGIPVKTQSSSVCVCECGVQKTILNYNLGSGRTKACGQCRPRESLIGRVFNRLTVIGDEVPRPGSAQWRSKCQCSCSPLSFVVVDNNLLKSGNTQSCGCRHSELQSQMMLKHGCAGGANRIQTREYVCWHNMKKRVTNTKAKEYSNYGGRGITVCGRWKDSFENFLADMGPCPPGLTIERKDDNGNYEPGNCVWANYKVQARNKRTNVVLTIRDTTACLKDLCLRFDKNYATVKGRIRRGWSPEKAMFEPDSQGIKTPEFLASVRS